MHHQDRVLTLIGQLPLAYGASIHQVLEDEQPPRKWFFPKSKFWDAMLSPSLAAIWSALANLEKTGMVTSEWSEERFGPRQYRRRYYHLTEAGRQRISELEAEFPAAA